MTTATYLYSTTTGGFYRTDMHANIPDDAIPISAETHAELVNGISHGMRIVIDATGNPKLTDPPAPPLDDVKAAKIAGIREHRDALTEDYIVIDGNHYHSDPKSRIQQMGLAKLAENNAIPEGLQWMTKNNGLITMTDAIALQFEPVTLAHDMGLFAAAQAHIDNVNALDTAEGIAAYNITTGWPQT